MSGSSFAGPLRHSRSAGPLRQWFDSFPLGFDPDFCVQFYDFLEVDDDQTNLYTVIKDSSAAVGILADTQHGVLRFSSAATTDDDGASIQGNEVYKLTAGKKIWFEVRVKVSDADQMDVFAGLSVNFATNPEAVLTAADRAGFQINDGGASILCKTEKNGTETSTDSGQDASDDTYVKLGMLIEGTSKVEFYVNRLRVATHTTNLPDDEELTFALFHLSGNATGTKTSDWDYLLIACER